MSYWGALRITMNKESLIDFRCSLEVGKRSLRLIGTRWELVGTRWNSLGVVGTRWVSLRLVGCRWNSSYFLVTPLTKKRAKILSSIWMVKDSTHKVTRVSITLMVLLEESRSGEHSKDKSGRMCDGSCLSAALEVLSLNNISRDYFSKRVVKALHIGKSKGYSMMICDQTNCTKSTDVY